MDFPPWTCRINPKKHGTYTTANCPKCIAQEKREENRKARARLKTYRVHLARSSEAVFVVKANNVIEAGEKATRIWRRHGAAITVTDVQQIAKLLDIK